MERSKPLFQVKLKEQMPFLYKGNPTWYGVGQVLDVIEIVTMPVVGKCYKIAYAGFPFDGVAVADSFEVLHE